MTLHRYHAELCGKYDAIHRRLWQLSEKDWALPSGPLHDILQEVAREYCVRARDIRGPRKFWFLTRPRQDFCYRAYTAKVDRKSLPQIARFLGNRHHTTILSAARAHAERHGLPRPDRGGFRPGRGA